MTPIAPGPERPQDGTGRLQRCIRDLAALNALPSLCVARSPEEALEVESLRSNVRVLVVDDNVEVAELLSEVLQEHGFQTAIAHDGESALVRWRRGLRGGSAQPDQTDQNT